MVSTYRRKKEDTLDKLSNQYNNSDNPGLVQLVNYLKFSARYRKPDTMLPRTAAVKGAASSNTNVNYIQAIKPPYNNLALDRFEDAFRSDKLIQNGIVKRVELVIGRHGKVVMDTTEEHDNPDDRTAALEKVNNNTKYQDARKKIQRLHIKQDINFHTNLKASVIQSQVYGRNAIKEVGNDDDGMPKALNVLNSKRLAQPVINENWKFEGVHYRDLKKGPLGNEDVIPANELIYFAYRDFNVSEGSLFYGLSALEGVVDGSDSKRIAKQEDIKEIMKSNWAPFLILKFSNPNISIQQMQEVVNGMSPGMPFAHKQDVQSEIVNLQGDLKNISDCVDFLNRESLRELGVPAFIAGYEQIANYANSQQVLLAYKEIELEADRTWIKDVIQQQWLNKLFYELLDIDTEGGDIPEVKLSYEFEDVSFETTLDKTNAALLLFDRQLISGEKVLKIAGHEDQIEEYKLLKQEKERQRLEMLMKFQRQTKQNGNQQEGDQQDVTGNGQDQQSAQGQEVISNNKQVSTTMRKRQGSTNLDSMMYEKIAETLDAIAEK